jgi:hypothetical protein
MQESNNKNNQIFDSTKADENTNQKKRSKGKIYLIVACCLVATLGLAFFAYTIVTKDKRSTDSNSVSNTEPTSNEEEYKRYSKCYVIANKVYLRSTPNKANDNVVGELKFGTLVYVKDYDKVYENDFIQVCLTKPSNQLNQNNSPSFVSSSTLVSEYAYTEFKTSFSLPEFSKLDSKLKKLVLDNSTSDGIKYSLTQNASKAKTSIAYGDYDSDGLEDVALILDDLKSQSSRILVICNNKVTQEPYIAFSENFGEYFAVRSFKKGTKIFINSPNVVPAPVDGLVFQNENTRLALLCNRLTKKFKEYDQHPVIEEEEEEREEEEENSQNQNTNI